MLLGPGCKRQKNADEKDNTSFESKSPHSFSINFADSLKTQELIRDSLIFGSSAGVASAEIAGKGALKITTDTEFSDAFLDLENLFGHPIDFTQSRYMLMTFLVPDESWITALKFNFRDADGNFGGANEIANNFYGNYNRWSTVLIDLNEVRPEFKNWHGEESPLPRVSEFSFNPYNANQADTSAVYIHSLALLDTIPEQQNFDLALTERPKIGSNNPYTITFNDEQLLHRQMAIRAFEATGQAMADSVAGNETMAIRLKGLEDNTHLAFLPILDKMTGAPVDFTKVCRLTFSYYLTDDSADFDGACLYLANEHWQSVLYDKTVFTDFKRGVWADVSIDLADIDLKLVRGEGPVLPNVYEIRLGLNYRPGGKDIEMWLDNFGWE